MYEKALQALKRVNAGVDQFAMAPIRAICRHMTLLARSEQGMALPTALFATIAAMALGGAAVMSSVTVQRGTHRDSGSKSAIAAADAGANVAMLRLTRDAGQLSSSTCLEGTSAQGDGWCSPTEPTEVGGAEYTYQVSQVGTGCGEFDLCVVATGTVGDVTRRVLVTFNEGPGGPGGGGGDPDEEEGETGSGGPEGLIGVDDVEIDNNADARVSVGTNGSIYVHNNGNVCGHIRHGVGEEATFENNGTQCSGYTITEGNLSLPEVSSFMPSDIATNNSNYRLVECDSAGDPPGCQSDGYSKKWQDDEPWDPVTRTISTSNNTTLTLGSYGDYNDYFVCRLELSNNSHLIMADGAHVRVFFDTPENCGLSSGTKQIDISNNANITSTGYQPTQGKFDLPGFYVMGSKTISTTVEWSNNSGTNEFVLYAPNSDVHLQNNAVFTGMIAGKTVHLENNAIVKQDDGFVLPPELNPWEMGDDESEPEGEPPESPPSFTAQFYVECSGAPSPAPDAGC